MIAVDHDAVYEQRFGESEGPGRVAMWREIGSFLQRFIPADSVTLDIAADKGLFISSIRARECWATDIRDTSAAMPAHVKFVQSNGLGLRESRATYS